MKSLLNRFSKKKDEPAGFNPNPAPAAEKKAGSGLTVRRLILPAFVVSVVVMLAAAGATYLQFTLLGEQNHDTVAQGRAERIAATVSGRLQGYADVMYATVHQPAVLQALGTGDRAVLQQHGAALRQVLPDVVRAQFLRVGEDQVDETSTPTLGYACLDLARIAEGGQMPPVETHQFGTKDQHIDLLQAVVNERNVVLGTLLVSLDVAVLKAWLEEAMPADGGYAELRQGESGKHLLLAGFGSTALQNLPGAHSARVPGSSWSVSSWTPESLTALSAAQQSAFFTVFGVAVVVLVVTFGLLTTLASRIVKNDLVAVVKQALEMWGGQRAHTFDVKLAESFEVLAALEQRFVELNPKPTVHPDAKKAAAMQKEQESGIVVDEPPAADEDLPSSLMFMSKDAVEVEELGPAGINNGDTKDK